MEIVFSCCPVPETGCTYSHGYWKNHSEAWPVDQFDLGSNNYDQSLLLSILAEPTMGNGLVTLARQLIAAKLNVANGADPAAVSGALAAAEALIGALEVPPTGDGFLAPSSADSLAQTLDNYNNGLIGPGHCED